MTIKLPSFPRELVGSDRLSLSLSLSASFSKKKTERNDPAFFRNSWTVWKNEDGKWRSDSSLLSSPLRGVSLSILLGKKRKAVGRLLSSTHWIACGSRRNDLVCRDHRFHRDTESGGGSASMETFSLFLFSFSLFFSFFF